MRAPQENSVIQPSTYAIEECADEQTWRLHDEEQNRQRELSMMAQEDKWTVLEDGRWTQYHPHKWRLWDWDWDWMEETAQRVLDEVE